MAYSRQRESIYDALCISCRHPTAEEIYSDLKPENPALSLATVYRNLNLLASKGKVLKIPVPGGADRFDATIKRHYHMVCDVCGAVVDIPDDCVKVDDMNMLDSTGCRLRSYDVLLYGFCPECNASLCRNKV